MVSLSSDGTYLSTQKAQACRCLWVGGLPGLYKPVPGQPELYNETVSKNQHSKTHQIDNQLSASQAVQPWPHQNILSASWSLISLCQLACLQDSQSSPPSPCPQVTLLIIHSGAASQGSLYVSSPWTAMAMAIPDTPQKQLMAKDECCFVYCLDIRLSREGALKWLGKSSWNSWQGAFSDPQLLTPKPHNTATSCQSLMVLSTL